MVHHPVVGGVLLASVLATTGHHTVAAQPPMTVAPSVDVETIGPKIGTKAPAFNLKDQHGALRSLESLMGPNGAVLVFFRSADW